MIRVAVIILTQVPIIYFELGRRDLLGGFNQTSEGFSLLIGLFLIVPLVNLVWLVVETARCFRAVRETGLDRTVLRPLVALLFLLEAMAIDLYLLSHARM